MHIIALQKRVLDANPWVARNLYNAVLASKNRSVERLMRLDQVRRHRQGVVEVGE